ncbi:MAG TPA: molybdopterin converting factor subunit 1 [Micropepsaceae bacterium]|nr:molybdopterin converting factor subunit 1 [Micropepsaceae bacterium]
MKLLYFAWVRQKVGRSEEDLTPSPSVASVSALIEFLKARGENYQAAFRDLEALRVAVNQQHCSFDTAIGPHDEIAFFPPVTGG